MNRLILTSTITLALILLILGVLGTPQVLGQADDDSDAVDPRPAPVSDCVPADYWVVEDAGLRPSLRLVEDDGNGRAEPNGRALGQERRIPAGTERIVVRVGVLNADPEALVQVTIVEQGVPSNRTSATAPVAEASRRGGILSLPLRLTSSADGRGNFTVTAQLLNPPSVDMPDTKETELFFDSFDI